MERDVTGWQFEAVMKNPGGLDGARRMVEIYAAHIPGKAAAWAAVAKEVNRTDPLAPLVVIGQVSEAVLLGEGITAGQVKLTNRIL